MDIPHVTAVELPLVVRNVDKAIAMIGGKRHISEVINSPDKLSNLNNHTTVENTLELRLRNDPFHHPVQSLYNTSEKILLKVSVPKKALPPDYASNPDKYSVQQLVEINNNNKQTPKHRVNPVAIIDKTYLFKSIADFQISTKHNETVQEFNKSILNSNQYQTVKSYFDKHNSFTGISDYKDSGLYSLNIDHQLPPPPILSPIRFPFDYRYQKNPFTTAVKDAKSGEVKMLSTKGSVKLYTKMIDYNTNEVPQLPALELVDNLDLLVKRQLSVNSSEYSLLQCIQWLKSIFEIKPIWLRKQLEDIASDDLRRFIKQALPYVTYIYKSGPWRFCNVKFGVDPKSSTSYWIYQSEYFRIPGLKFVRSKLASRRVVPNTVVESNKHAKKGLNAVEVEVSEFLFFNGVTLPSTVTYQIGDILDLDITTIVEDHQKYFGSSFLRETPDFQDGWINRQTMEVIRRIIRYKLNRIVKEEPIDQNKIYKIMNADYVLNDEHMEPDDDDTTAVKIEEDLDTGVGDDEEDEVLAEEEDVLAEEEEDQDQEEVKDENGETEEDEASLMNKLNHLNQESSSGLAELVGFIKQDSIEKEP